MKKLGLILMVLGILVVGLAGGYYKSSGAPQRCLESRQRALDLADKAVAAGEGTPEAQQLMTESQDASGWADIECNTAAAHKNLTVMIAGAGGLLLVIGLVLALRAPKAPAG